jgi:hypothetical protein
MTCTVGMAGDGGAIEAVAESASCGPNFKVVASSIEVKCHAAESAAVACCKLDRSNVRARSDVHRSHVEKICLNALYLKEDDSDTKDAEGEKKERKRTDRLALRFELILLCLKRRNVG